MSEGAAPVTGSFDQPGRSRTSVPPARTQESTRKWVASWKNLLFVFPDTEGRVFVAPVLSQKGFQYAHS